MTSSMQITGQGGVGYQINLNVYVSGTRANCLVGGYRLWSSLERRWAPPSVFAHRNTRMDKAAKKNNMPDRPSPGLPTPAPTTGVLQGGGDKCDTGAQPPPTCIKLQAKETIIGTWNVRTLYACGKVNELTHELKRYRWDILGLCEVRWTGFGEATTDEGHKIWYSGDNSKHQHGVGFIVNKQRVNSILSCTPISKRLITMRIAAKPQNITILQVYAPTSDYDDEDVESFYGELEEAIKAVPRKDFLVVQGDWNAKIGPDAYDQWAGTTGRFGEGETNDRGLRLLEFASSHNLTVTNTLHPHKKSRRTTWHAPNGAVHNQIDYILTPRRFKSSINKAQTRSFPGADVGSDHDMVLMSLRLKLKTNYQQKTTRLRFNLGKLKDPTVAEIFQAEIGGRFAALNFMQEDINSLTEDVNRAIQETAQEVLGKERTKNRPWVTDEVLDLCDKRRELKASKNTSDETAEEYRAINRNIRKKMCEAKENWLSEECNTVEHEFAKGNSQLAFQTIKRLTKTKQSKSTMIEDKNGSILTENEAILKRWTEYCHELYNYELKVDPTILKTDLSDRTSDPGSSQVLREEVAEAVHSLKGGKSPGIDNIPAELIKHGGAEMINALTTICQRIWTSKKWPEEWTKSIIIPLPKKGNLKKCQNYRTISLISHPSKIMLRIILNRLKPKSEEILSEEQAGFRPGRSTVEQIFNIRLLIEKYLQHQQELYHNFIDFKKAFDRVWHDGLWYVMRQYNFDEDIIQLIQALYKNARSAVLMDGQLGELFQTTVGVRQGCLLSPMLFNIFLENIMQEALLHFETSVTIGGRPISNLRFADDIDLIARKEKELQDLTIRLDTSASAYGMELSTEKSKILVNSDAPTTPTNIIMSGQTLEEVESFKYLGSIINREGTSTNEIKSRLAIALSSMAKLSLLWSRHIRLHTKVRLYKALVVSIALYGCESWTLTAETERRIQAFEMKCLRRILNISYKDHKTNEHVWQMITSIAGKQEPLLTTVRRRKLQWFGHVTRHDSLAKTVLQGTVEGGRKRGRPRKSWTSNIKEWTAMDLPTLLERAQDRNKWRTTCSSQPGTPTVSRPRVE